MGFPLLQKSVEMCVDRQIKVLGSYWKGRMSNEESNSLYLYTVRDYHELNKWDVGGTPSQTIEGERRQDEVRRHSDLYSRVEPVIYSDFVVLSHLTVIE